MLTVTVSVEDVVIEAALLTTLSRPGRSKITALTGDTIAVKVIA